MARKVNLRSLQESILIVVEGETELIYFNQLKADYRLPHLSIEPKISPQKDPVSIVNRAILENERKEFDITWCIFDLDIINQFAIKFEKARLIARKNHFYLAESFPCFEIWFLLHFTFTTRPYQNYSQLEAELCKYISDYCKKQSYLQKKNLYRCLKDKIDNAVENCIKLEKYNIENNIDIGTKCDIYKIIKKIEQL